MKKGEGHDKASAFSVKSEEMKFLLVSFFIMSNLCLLILPLITGTSKAGSRSGIRKPSEQCSLSCLRMTFVPSLAYGQHEWNKILRITVVANYGFSEFQ